LPSGKRIPVSGHRDLNVPRPFADLSVDDVLTDLPSDPTAADGLSERGRIDRESLSVVIRSSPDFREVVAFTPPHRQAFAIEPSTGTTDAINLRQRGIDAGLRVLGPAEPSSGVVPPFQIGFEPPHLRVLQPGESWSGMVEFAVSGGVS